MSGRKVDGRVTALSGTNFGHPVSTHNWLQAPNDGESPEPPIVYRQARESMAGGVSLNAVKAGKPPLALQRLINARVLSLSRPLLAKKSQQRTRVFGFAAPAMRATSAQTVP